MRFHPDCAGRPDTPEMPHLFHVAPSQLCKMAMCVINGLMSSRSSLVSFGCRMSETTEWCFLQHERQKQLRRGQSLLPCVKFRSSQRWRFKSILLPLLYRLFMDCMLSCYRERRLVTGLPREG